MKRTAIILLQVFGIILYQSSYAQQTPPAIEWHKSLGGSYDDEATSIQQTRDSGYIVAGWSKSANGNVTVNHGKGDYWIVKLNHIGAMDWQRSLGGSEFEKAYSIRQTRDNGYIVVGWSASNDGDVTGLYDTNNYANCWIVKLNDTGLVQWQKSFRGGNGSDSRSIQQTRDGGYIVAGWYYSNGSILNPDYWIVKINDTGAIEWQRFLGGSDGDCATSIQQTKDGGYIVAGWSESTDGDVMGNHGSYDVWVVKLNDTGTIQWQRPLGGSGHDVSNCIQQTLDGGYIVAGYSRSKDGDLTENPAISYLGDFWILKLNDSGAIQWQRLLGGSKYEHAYSIEQTDDGGYIVAGESTSTADEIAGNHGKCDAWIVKLNATGSIVWERLLGGSKDDEACSIQQTIDGGYVVVGISKSNDGDVTGNHGNDDYWIIKLAPEIQSK